MRRKAGRVIITLVTSGLLLTQAACSRPIPGRIEGVGEIKLCMKEEEFRSRLEPLLRPYLNRPITRWDTPWPPPRPLYFPPGSGLVPSEISVAFREGLLADLWIYYEWEDYPGEIESVYWKIRNYLENTYPKEPNSSFTWDVDRWENAPYFAALWDRAGNVITLDVDRSTASVEWAYWARGHGVGKTIFPEKKFCEGAR